MNKLWKHSSRNTLKGASSCNNFFLTDRFSDSGFDIKIPMDFAKLIDKDDPKDPLLRQVINPKSNSETNFSKSPLEDEKYSPVDGLIHKYSNRVLLIASRVCSIHCQYCFRQNFDYAGQDALNNWYAVKEYITNNPKINEVILSGGDPLTLSDEKIKFIVLDIEKIPHIDTLRIHTRTAVVIPNRITNELASILNNSSLNVVMVFHINHENELTYEFKKSLKMLDQIILLNQSVLLKGVNDSEDVLANLFLKLFSYKILPYYLHMLDKVRGSEHLFVSDKRAIKIHNNLKKKLSGYLVPRLVRDENDEFKAWLGL